MLKLLLPLYANAPLVVEKSAFLRRHAPGRSEAERSAFVHSLTSFDWQWFAVFLAGSAVCFGIILFGLLFFRRWGVPRLGYFFVTIIVLLNRAMQPNILFWQAFGVFTGGICVFMAFYQTRGREFVVGKEPVYFLLNSFALIVSSLWTSAYLTGLSAFALFASLFFITTKNPRRPGKHGKADQYVLESLERKAQRK